jgi:hypothetical protein
VRERFAWLPFYLLVVIALTLFPFRAAHCEGPGWGASINGADFLQNVLLFAPLGVALVHSSATRALTFAVGLSLAIELTQARLPREQDVVDLLSNGLGALAGRALASFWLARFDPPLLRPSTWRLGLRVGACVMAVAAIVSAILNPATDFSNWESFPVVLGNEATGGRPWLGEIAELTIWDRALHEGQEQEVEAVRAAWRSGGPILWLRYQEPTGGRIDGPGGPRLHPPRLDGPPSWGLRATGLDLRPSGIWLDPAVSRHLLERLRAAGQMTLDVRFRSASVDQTGPARIISFGGDPRHRNFMLGQEKSELRVRLRTPATGPNGAPPELDSGQGSISTEPQRVRVVFDGHDAFIYVDGVCVDETELSVEAAWLPLSVWLGATLVGCVGLCGLALASWWPRRPWLAHAIGGVGIWLALRGVGAFSHIADFELASLALGALALLAALPLVPLVSRD